MRKKSRSKKPPPNQLSDRQLAILRILWKNKQGTVNEVHAQLGPKLGIARSTIATMLTRLAEQGVLEAISNEREFVFRPIASESQWLECMVEEFSDRVFEGDLAGTVARLVQTSGVSRAEIKRAKALIEAAELSLAKPKRKDTK